MTIDERLGALTQSVELLTHDMHDLQSIHEENVKAWRERELQIDKRAARIDALRSDMMLAIARLANTTQTH